MVKSAFLRSINIQMDVGHPDRISHFRPTSKSVRLVSSLLQATAGNAIFVVAPYGSGKSITAGYVGELVENREDSAPVLQSIATRVAEIDAPLGKRARVRQEKGEQGLFVPMYGHVPATPQALKEGILASMRRCKLGREARTIERLDASAAGDVATLVSVCCEKLEQAGFDRLVIVWDEFGRHLQGLISEGRPEELDVLQVLAESVTRASRVPVSLVLLLHRSLLGYASGLPSGVKREWAKIEGRFETLQYVDDSAELYDLIGSLVEEVSESDAATEVDFVQLAEEAQEIGLFPDVDESRLADLLETAHPLDPATLYLLPRVAARVAQNERTLFSFLQWVSLEEPVSPGVIYDYFRGDFRTDTGAGGTQRPWLETESAIQKVSEGSIEAEGLKCAFLLGLGLGGERSHATYSQLEFALSPLEADEASEVIDALIDQKLLVHRRHSDQVVVWHGTDVDLRGRLEDEKKRSSSDFSLAPFLTRELPPPVWRPVEYNARHGIRRYLEAEYVTVDGLQAFLTELELSGGWETGTDGRVLYVLPNSAEELAEAQRIAGEVENPRLFIVVADDVTTLREAALDLWCLLRMHADQELIASDPMVKAELDHLTDDARTGLQPLVDRVVQPQREGSHWYHRGKRLHLTSVPQFRRQLSKTMMEVFSATPEIDSEMVVRRSPSSVIINARKKVALGLLERYGQEDIGIEGSYADRAIFRCVFFRTGLYREKGKRWSLADPDELELPGLAAVWRRVRQFFVEPGTNKSFRPFIDELLEPPYGVREGLIPLFLAAGVKAFPTAIAIRHKGQFVDDLLPSVIEDIAKEPDDFVLDVVGLTASQKKYLAGVLELFAVEESRVPQDGNLLRHCMDAVVAWRHALPLAVSDSRYLSKEGRTFERELSVPDPVRLFLEELPRLVGHSTEDPEALLAGVAQVKGELEGIEDLFLGEAVEALNQTLTARGVRNGAGVREQAARWASHFPKSFGPKLPDRVTQGVLSRLKAPYRDDATLVNALSTLLIGKTIRQWDDAVVPAFRRQLRSAFEVIEGTALEMSQSTELDEELREGLIGLAEAKAATIAAQLADIVGSERAARKLEELAQQMRTETVARKE